MDECQYGKNGYIQYYDFGKKEFVPYKCHNSVVSNGAYCKFHDIVYANANPEAVMNSFYELVNDTIQYAKPLFCIGYNLGGRVNLDRKFSSYVYFSSATFNNVADLHFVAFKENAKFSYAKFNNEADFSYAKFNNVADFHFVAFKEKAGFSFSDFGGETEFNRSIFPSYDMMEYVITYPPIEFDYSTFRKRVRFIGTPDNQIELGLVSFRGVELSNAEFHNVKWSKEKRFLITRNIIIDEKLVGMKRNYEDVAKIYNQLRKNYESRLLFNEASHFFVGEMEAIRKSLYRRRAKKGEITESIRNRFASIGYLVYKYFALYGESALLPLFIWTPSIIFVFTLLRYVFGICSVEFQGDVISLQQSECSIGDPVIDSLAAYFQFPRSQNALDTLERMISIPFLGTAFIALRRKFERIK